LQVFTLDMDLVAQTTAEAGGIMDAGAQDALNMVGQYDPGSVGRWRKLRFRHGGRTPAALLSSRSIHDYAKD